MKIREKNKKIRFKIIWKFFLNYVMISYVYLLGFYISFRVLALFFKPFKKIFYWQAFDIVMVVFTFLVLINPRFLNYFKGFLSKLTSIHWTKLLFLKIIIFVSILVYALFKGILFIEFIVLFYALVSVLFIIDIRISLGFALFFLVLSPLLLLWDKKHVAEISTVYAFYFLIIVVLTQIRFFKKGD